MTNLLSEQPIYFIDAEFIEDGRRRTIDLISIGIVSQDGREYYACNDDCDLSKANDWVKVNVIPNLPPKHIDVNPGNPDTPPSVREDMLKWKLLDTIAKDILEFCNPEQYGTPIFWGEWASYDWITFCWIFGDMVDLPKGFPMRPRDVMQWAEDHLGINERELPPSFETDGNHSALLGARSVKRKWEHCWEVEAEREMRKDARYSEAMESLSNIDGLLRGENIDAAFDEIEKLKKIVERLASA